MGVKGPSKPIFQFGKRMVLDDLPLLILWEISEVDGSVLHKIGPFSFGINRLPIRRIGFFDFFEETFLEHFLV